jgi:hypothetical protein
MQGSLAVKSLTANVSKWSMVFAQRGSFAMSKKSILALTLHRQYFAAEENSTNQGM